MKQPLHLLDVVALLEDLPDRRLLAGKVGTIVEILSDGVYEVEFADNEGQTYSCLALQGNQVMPLHYSPIAA
jgi:hypothetical protein